MGSSRCTWRTDLEKSVITQNLEQRGYQRTESDGIFWGRTGSGGVRLINCILSILMFDLVFVFTVDWNFYWYDTLKRVIYW